MRNRISLILALVLGLCVLTLNVNAQTPKENYCIWPQFLSTGGTPDVLLLMDNSDSMTCRAYANQVFNPGRSYYGIFDSTKWYQYAGGAFSAVEDKANWNPGIWNLSILIPSRHIPDCTTGFQ